MFDIIFRLIVNTVIDAIKYTAVPFADLPDLRCPVSVSTRSGLDTQ